MAIPARYKRVVAATRGSRFRSRRTTRGSRSRMMTPARRRGGNTTRTIQASPRASAKAAATPTTAHAACPQRRKVASHRCSVMSDPFSRCLKFAGAGAPVDAPLLSPRSSWRRRPPSVHRADARDQRLVSPQPAPPRRGSVGASGGSMARYAVDRIVLDPVLWPNRGRSPMSTPSRTRARTTIRASGDGKLLSGHGTLRTHSCRSSPHACHLARRHVTIPRPLRRPRFAEPNPCSSILAALHRRQGLSRRASPRRRSGRNLP